MSLTQVDLRIEYKHNLTSKFNPETRCISELYWSFIRDYETGKVRKCNIVISDNWQDDIYHYTDWSDCKGINMPFDFHKYFRLDKKKRKRMQLEVVHSGMMKIALKEGWNPDPLMDAYNCCLERDLEYKFLVGNKLKASPDRKHKLGFWCDWDIDKFEVYWVLFDKNDKEVARELLIEKEPFKGEFVYYLSWKWKDNQTVFLEDKYKYGNRASWVFKV